MGRSKITFSQEQDLFIVELFTNNLSAVEVVNRFQQRFQHRVYSTLRNRFLEITIQRSGNKLNKFFC